MNILDELISRYPPLAACRGDILSAFHILRQTFASGGKLLVCGNGGSCADAEHIVGELAKGFLSRRPLSGPEAQALRALGGEGAYLADKLQGGLPALSLNLPALGTAALNDLGGNLNFAQAAHALARPGDAFLGITTSGNAENVRLAALAARTRGAKILGLTGESGGKLKSVCDACIRVPDRETYIIQEYHLPVYHALCAMVEAEFFPEPRQ